MKGGRDGGEGCGSSIIHVVMWFRSLPRPVRVAAIDPHRSSPQHANWRRCMTVDECRVEATEVTWGGGSKGLTGRRGKVGK